MTLVENSNALKYIFFDAKGVTKATNSKKTATAKLIIYMASQYT
jgi:hypothetical protein